MCDQMNDPNIPLNTEVGFFGPPPSYLPYKAAITQSKNY